eukprot:5453761-Prymnesium_polylepis.1
MRLAPRERTLLEARAAQLLEPPQLLIGRRLGLDGVVRVEAVLMPVAHAARRRARRLGHLRLVAQQEAAGRAREWANRRLERLTRAEGANARTTPRGGPNARGSISRQRGSGARRGCGRAPQQPQIIVDGWRVERLGRNEAAERFELVRMR